MEATGSNDEGTSNEEDSVSYRLLVAITTTKWLERKREAPV